MMTLSGRRSRTRERPQMAIELPRNVEAPSVARAAITGFLQERSLPLNELATLKLLVSELVSNAVVHSDGPPGSDILLRADLTGGDRVRVEVSDHGSGFTPVPRDPERYDGGFGLHLVESQSDRWGVSRTDASVWFELALGSR